MGLLNIFDDIRSDFRYCFKLFVVLYKISPRARSVMGITFFVLVFFTSLQVKTHDGALSYLWKIIPSLLVSCFVFATSEHLFYIWKKNKQFLALIHSRKSIRLCLSQIQDKNIKDIVSPQGGLYIFAVEYLSSTESTLRRLGIELAVVLFFLYPLFMILFLFNLAIIVLSFIYVLFFQEMDENINRNLVEIVHCINQMYTESPESCADFILENQMREIKEFSTIFSVISHDNKN